MKAKKITVRRAPPFLTIEFLKQIMGNASTSQMTIAQVRERARVVDVLEKHSDGDLVVTVADWNLIKATRDQTSYTIAHPRLVQIFDDIDNAVDVELEETRSERA